RGGGEGRRGGWAPAEAARDRQRAAGEGGGAMMQRMAEPSDSVLPASFVEEAFALLVGLVRSDTSHPGAVERPAAERCAEELRRDGLEPRLLEAAPGRTNLVCRLRGTGEAPPLLLTGHLDVVPPGEGWSRPPFGGVVEDGFLWG